MTDKEKIEKIMFDKQLNNTQFSSMIGISPGALSHITGGRTNPTLGILRSIKDAFPDLNPQWLFFDEGSMYLTEKNESAATGDDADSSSEDGLQSQERSEEAKFVFQPDLFANQQAASSMRGSTAPRSAQPSPFATPNAADLKEMIRTATEMVNIEDIVKQSVAQTVDHLKQNQRKIIEVRVFFDDGTFETFSNK